MSGSFITATLVLLSITLVRYFSTIHNTALVFLFLFRQCTILPHTVLFGSVKIPSLLDTCLT